MTNKQKYRQFCEQEQEMPIFNQYWWLDAVCGSDNWEVLLAEKGGQIIASWTYYFTKRNGFSYIEMPALTQNMGLYIKYPLHKKYYKRLSIEKEIINELLGKLPKTDSFFQRFNYKFTNWLPLYWADFQQTTRYTYVVDNLSNLDAVWRGFAYSKRKNLKKAEKNVTVKFDLSAEDFYSNHKMTLSKQGQKIIYDFDVFKSIYSACYRRNSGKTIYAVDAKNNIHAALFVVWDKTSAYDLISTIDPDFRNSGAATLLVKEIIKYVSNHTLKFDFEGSMIEGVENSFRRFGAEQKSYFQITKTNSKLLKIYRFIKEF